ETSNVLAEEVNDQYLHVTTFCEIKQPDLALLRQLVNVTASDSITSKADILDALILATHTISVECGRLKYNKQIVLITDSVDEIDWRDMEDVINMLKAEEIKLVIIGVDFDKDGILNNETNQEGWSNIIKNIPNGSIHSLSEAYESTQEFKTKEMRPTPIFRGFLHLGNNETYGTRALTASVNMYAYTSEVKPPAAKKWSTLSDLNLANRESLSTSDSMATKPSYRVETERRYRIKNIGDISSTQMDVDINALTDDAMEKAYCFGKSLVQVTREEEDALVLPTSPGMWIHGFYKKSAVPQSYFLSNVYSIVAGNYDTKIAGTIISTLARSLYEREEVALVRYVSRPNNPPKMGVLFPYIDIDINVLQFCQVPFSEDFRQFTFPSLDKVITKNGTVLTEDHPLLPDKDMKKAISKDGCEEPYAPEDCYNPVIWLTNTAIKARALNDAAPIPKLNSKLKRQFEIIPNLFNQNEQLINDMEKLFNVKKDDVIGDINSYQANKFSTPSLSSQKEQYQDTNMSFLQVVNKNDDIRKVTTETPIDDFNAMLQNRQVDLVTDAAIRCLKVLREAASKENEAKLFNQCMHQLKQIVDLSNPDALHLDFWHLLQKQNITLITKEEADDDEVATLTKDDAHKVSFFFIINILE
ncbi:SPOC like C-terminal domain-containing protein, partial [Cunninghamella echinulata]